MKKLITVLILCLIFFVVFFIGFSKGGTGKLPNSIKDLKFENIKSGKIELGTIGANPTKNYTFDFNNPDQTKIIKDIISQLNSAKVQGYADEKVTNKGSLPTFLILEFKDGLIMRVKSAVGGKCTKLSDGSTEIAQLDIPNEVTISTNSNIKPFRIASPEIRKLIDIGYKDIFK